MKPEALEYQPLWRERSKLYAFFQESPSDSLRGRIWHKAISKSSYQASAVNDDVYVAACEAGKVCLTLYSGRFSSLSWAIHVS